MSSTLSETDALKKEKSNLLEEVKRSSFRIEDVERERNIVLEEAESLRKLHSEKLQEAVNEWSGRTRSIEKQLLESHERIRVSESRAKDIIKLQEKLSDKWKKEHIATVKYYETMLSD